MLYCNICDKEIEESQVKTIKTGMTQAYICPVCEGPVFPIKENTQNKADSNPHPLKLIFFALLDHEILNDIEYRLKDNKSYFIRSLFYSYGVLFLSTLIIMITIKNADVIPDELKKASTIIILGKQLLFLLTLPIITLYSTYPMHLSAYLFGVSGSFLGLWWGMYLLYCSMFFYGTILGLLAITGFSPMILFILFLVFSILCLSRFNYVIMHAYGCNSIVALLLYFGSVGILVVTNIVFGLLS